MNLAECLVDTWGGFVFINMDADAEPLTDFLDPLPSDDHLGLFQLEQMRYQSHRIIELNVNWKSALDAFTEATTSPVRIRSPCHACRTSDRSTTSSGSTPAA